MISTEKKKLLDEAIGKIWPDLYAWSAVSDRWLEDIKVLRGIEISDPLVASIFFETQIFGKIIIEELLEKYLNKEELDYAKNELEEKLTWMASNTLDDPKEKESTYLKLFKDHYEARLDTYKGTDKAVELAKVLKIHLGEQFPDELIIGYVNMKLQDFQDDVGLNKAKHFLEQL